MRRNLEFIVKIDTVENCEEIQFEIVSPEIGFRVGVQRMILRRLVAEKKVGCRACECSGRRRKRQQYFDLGFHPGEMVDFEPKLRTGGAMCEGNLPEGYGQLRAVCGGVFAVSGNWQRENEIFDAVEAEVVRFSA